MRSSPLWLLRLDQRVQEHQKLLQEAGQLEELYERNAATMSLSLCLAEGSQLVLLISCLSFESI